MAIIGILDRFIQKAEEDDEKELKDIGYLETAVTIKTMADLEEKIAEAINSQSDRFCADLADSESLQEYLKKGFDSFVKDDSIKKEMKLILEKFSDEALKTLTEAYLDEAGLSWVSYTDRTIDTVQQWAEDTAQFFADGTFDQLRKILDDGVKAGKGVDKISREIQKEGIRNTYFKARTVAQTETLRMHSYAANEAMIQTPWVEKKRWHHTGAHKNKPRPNHQAMSGEEVSKTERFALHGADGCIYHPMFPRDSCLPASESVNCKCILQRVESNEPVAFDFDEKKRLQEQAIEDDNKAWKEELDKEPETSTDGMLEWLKGLDKEQQVQYFGNGYAGRQRWALTESGVLDTDEKFQQLFKTNEKGVRSRKSLKELSHDGIMTVNSKALDHSNIGEYKPASKQWPSGRLIAGGHGQAAIEECKNLGIDYEITGTFSNGVRIGNVPSAKLKIKQTGSGQAWFPEDWSEDDILVAGTYVSNSNAKLVDGYHKTAVYNNVAVRVLYTDGNIATICPDLDQDIYVEGAKRNG